MAQKRAVLWTIVLVASIGAVGYRFSVFREPPPPPPAKIVFVTGGSGWYWQDTIAGAKTAAKDFNAELSIESPAEQENAAQQTAILEAIDAQAIDGVAVSPLDAAQQTELINHLVRDTLVVTFDSDAPESDRQSHVGTTNFSAGRACARVVGEALPEGGKIAVLVANLTKENMIDRKGAFQERIAQLADDVDDPATAPKLTVVGYLEDEGNDAKCAANIRDALAKDPDVACFVGMNARHGPILVKVLEELGKLGQIKLVTFDTAPETLDAIAAGHIYATLAQDSYGIGYESVRILCTLAHREAVEVPIVGKGSVYSGVDVVRQGDLDEFRQRMRRRARGGERPGAARAATAAAG